MRAKRKYTNPAPYYITLHNELTRYFQKGYTHIENEDAFNIVLKQMYPPKQEYQRSFEQLKNRVISYLTRIRNALYLGKKESEEKPLYDDAFAKYSCVIEFVEINKAIMEITNNQYSFKNITSTLNSYIWPEYATNRIIYKCKDYDITLQDVYEVCLALEGLTTNWMIGDILKHINPQYDGQNPLPLLLNKYTQDELINLGSIPFFIDYVGQRIEEYKQIAKQLIAEAQPLICEPPISAHIINDIEIKEQEEVKFLPKDVLDYYFLPPLPPLFPETQAHATTTSSVSSLSSQHEQYQ